VNNREPTVAYVVSDRRRSPDPIVSAYSARSAVEIADLQDKLDKSQAELRRAQAELRLNQTDYDRSHVELEQMQEKVRTWLLIRLLNGC
jgi:chromosome segregation and condensation protein ScpB